MYSYHASRFVQQNKFLKNTAYIALKGMYTYQGQQPM